jgi:hypothetical protein
MQEFALLLTVLLPGMCASLRAQDGNAEKMAVAKN